MNQLVIDKLQTIYETVKSCNGKKYSTLTLNEKRAVELLCSRALVTDKGAKSKEGSFTTLAISAHAGWAGKAILGGSQFPASQPSTLSIIEDVEMNWKELDVPHSNIETTNVFLDAILSWPDNYHAIRRYKGKTGITAFHGTEAKGYKEMPLKPPFLGYEVDYGIFPQWIKKEKPKVARTVEPNDVKTLILPLHFISKDILNMTPAVSALLTRGYFYDQDKEIVYRTEEYKEILEKLNLATSQVFKPAPTEEHLLAARRMYIQLEATEDDQGINNPLLRDIILADMGLRYKIN